MEGSDGVATINCSRDCVNSSASCFLHWPFPHPLRQWTMDSNHDKLQNLCSRVVRDKVKKLESRSSMHILYISRKQAFGRSGFKPPVLIWHLLFIWNFVDLISYKEKTTRIYSAQRCCFICCILHKTEQLFFLDSVLTSRECIGEVLTHWAPTPVANDWCSPLSLGTMPLTT